jgi:hypothetical protein
METVCNNCPVGTSKKKICAPSRLPTAIVFPSGEIAIAEPSGISAGKLFSNCKLDQFPACRTCNWLVPSALKLSAVEVAVISGTCVAGTSVSTGDGVTMGNEASGETRRQATRMKMAVMVNVKERRFKMRTPYSFGAMDCAASKLRNSANSRSRSCSKCSLGRLPIPLCK